MAKSAKDVIRFNALQRCLFSNSTRYNLSEEAAMITPDLHPYYGRIQRRDEPPPLWSRGADVRFREATAARRVLGLDPRLPDSHPMRRPAVDVAFRRLAEAAISRWANKVDDAWLAKDLA